MANEDSTKVLDDFEEMGSSSILLSQSSKHPSFVEPLLQPDENRFVMFPIVHHDIWSLYKKAIDSFWKVEDIDLSKDISDWNNLNTDEKHFLKMVLAFFSSSDGIIIENLSMRFSNEVQSSEVRAFYAFQNFIESVHCVTGNTRILIDDGYREIKDLVDKTVRVWNGEEFSTVNVVSTGDQEIYKVVLDNGMELDCTPGHKWLIADQIERIPTNRLQVGNILANFNLPIITKCIDPNEFQNPYTHGFFCSIGHYRDCSPIIILEGEKHNLLPYIAYDSFEFQKPDNKHSIVYIRNSINKAQFEVPINYSFDTKIRWLEGFVDAEGRTIWNKKRNATSIECISINKRFLQDIQLMLSTMGILARVLRIKGWYERWLPKNDGSGEYAQYSCRNCYSLGISTMGVRLLMKYGFAPKTLVLVCRPQKFMGDSLFSPKQVIRIKRIYKISDKQPTFCFEEPLRHTGTFNGIVTGQSEMYSQLIDTYVNNMDEKLKLFEATQNYPCIKKKADWGKKWISDHRSAFSTRLIAFAIIEGIFFSSSFAAIFWIKQRNILPGLCLSNEYISRDEGLHVEHAVLLYNKLKRRVAKKKFQEIMKEAVDIEIDFICNAIPCRLIGMNSDMMTEYIKFVADRLCVQLGYDKIYNSSNPFAFMELISVEKKTNFFEHRVSEYALANKTVDDNIFDLNCDF